MDQELRYPCNSVIDFFVDYGPARQLFTNEWELRNNSDCHIASKIPEAKKVNFTWALVTGGQEYILHLTRTLKACVGSL